MSSYSDDYSQNQPFQKVFTSYTNEIIQDELSSGIYFVTLRNQSNRQTIKIIKN
ncbi:T9SS type A sorting domain-containing protein [Draconibacterium orientale]|uniref:T9SS type A sorting domain-containing protein n=1 Tax=Draconibacterium orientale TaxID=1168034 RepID=UPI00374885BE